MRDLDWLKDVFRTLGEEQAVPSSRRTELEPAGAPGAEDGAADLLASLMASDQAAIRRAYVEAGAPYGPGEGGLWRWSHELQRQARAETCVGAARDAAD